MKRPGMPSVPVKPDVVVIGGGMMTEVPEIFAKPGTARLAYNYEWTVNGGVRRVGGIEPFDGRPSPSAAAYVLLQCVANITGVALGSTLDGDTSGASGTVIYVSGKSIAVTKITGTFEDDEDVSISASVVGTLADSNPPVDGFLDNQLNKLAADEYQADITKVPGQDEVRGIAVLENQVYAWRDAIGGASAAIFKASSSGWTAVNLGHQISFTAGSAEWAESSTLSQGGVSATVRRVVLESGTWAGGTAAGRMIISAPTGGSFSAGAGAGGGSATLSGASTAITLSPGGRVRTDRHGFNGRLERRLYGCDGVNPEFEFDGTVLVPLNTGMGSVRATSVRVHKNHVFFGYRGALQHSSIATPYIYSPITGASEIAAGDRITNLISVGGTTDSAALFVTCLNSLHVLYGTSSANWQFIPLSKVSGAIADSAQDIGGVVALDTPGVMRYPQTQNFGNFAWDLASMEIQSITREQDAYCSVYAAGLFVYRLFFRDGTAISGLPIGKGKFLWSQIDYGRAIILAENAEINGVSRTFYADDEGWVYEADVGRSFAGESIPRALLLHQLNQKSPMVEKTFRQMQLQMKCESACTVYTSGEFNESEGPSQSIATLQPGSGLAWDLSNFDQSYWDSARTGGLNVPLEGVGTGVTVSIAGEANDELPHTITSLLILYTPRKLQR
jgi:hypothetical protein